MPLSNNTDSAPATAAHESESASSEPVVANHTSESPPIPSASCHVSEMVCRRPPTITAAQRATFTARHDNLTGGTAEDWAPPERAFIEPVLSAASQSADAMFEATGDEPLTNLRLSIELKRMQSIITARRAWKPTPNIRTELLACEVMQGDRYANALRRLLEWLPDDRVEAAVKKCM